MGTIDLDIVVIAIAIAFAVAVAVAFAVIFITLLLDGRYDFDVNSCYSSVLLMITTVHGVLELLFYRVQRKVLHNNNILILKGAVKVTKKVLFVNLKPINLSWNDECFFSKNRITNDTVSALNVLNYCEISSTKDDDLQ
uniref:Uncharacterized protein n=1 Tax=Glossina brevipalpis TaxID=37001 RepID=A0A1A9WX18_9MUSC